ncbi:hypothetical protein IKF86_01545 [Candidatus Saccharibacteria bacterium]|nr:hypothetical protein [Candidatus Saccharibacteria bacterium]
MPKKNAKSKSKSKQSAVGQPSVSVGIIITLAISLIVAIVFAVCAIAQIKSYNSGLTAAKLEVFDHLVTEYVHDMEVSNEKATLNEITGYGVSDEDGVFYATFDYATYDLDENRMPQFDDIKHGIVYFWKDAERGTYSHAFSYHDDYYHPGGTYIEVGDHSLRSQIGQ